MIHVARRAEQLGYHSLWTFQRLLAPADLGWSETYHSVQDPLTTLAFLAAHTTRIRLGVAVLNMPFISPVVLAKQTATLDILAGGRLDVGLGLGWADEEYQATGAQQASAGPSGRGVPRRPPRPLAGRRRRASRRVLPGPADTSGAEARAAATPADPARRPRARGAAPGGPARRRLGQWQPGGPDRHRRGGRDGQGRRGGRRARSPLVAVRLPRCGPRTPDGPGRAQAAHRHARADPVGSRQTCRSRHHRTVRRPQLRPGDRLTRADAQASLRRADEVLDALAPTA